MWALPTPGLWNKYGFPGNNYSDDGIIVYRRKGSGYLKLTPVTFSVIGTEPVGHQIEVQVGLIPCPSSCNAVSIF